MSESGKHGRGCHRGHGDPLVEERGDRVEVDEPLLEVSTDKVDTEIPSPITPALSRPSWLPRRGLSQSAPLVTIGDGTG
jgi:2-oxoglutarate dehydrogenase E2 component (dihydrolipoamide succinyltransferase)